MPLPALFGVLISLFASAVLGQTKPVLTLTFDDGFDGKGQAGVVKAIPVEKPELAPGKFGQALKSGPTIGYVDYPTEGLLNLSGGTVEMWVCPLDWKPDDGKFHVFFEVRGEGALYLYKYWTGTNLLMLTCDDLSGPYAGSQTPTEHWKPGEWHHIAGTWSPQGVQAYVDGKPAGAYLVAGNPPKSFAKTFNIGDRPWQFERTTASLIDEVRIYDRPLTTAHIAAHAAGNYDFSMKLSSESSTLDYLIDPDAGRVHVRLDTNGADVDDAKLKAGIAIVPTGSGYPDKPSDLTFKRGQTQATLALPSRQPGQYDVIARLQSEGNPAIDMRCDLTIPSTEWLGSKLGLEDTVLPPWTPMKVRSAEVGMQNDKTTSEIVVACWGREYTFNQSLFPIQIRTAGAEVLARPMALKLMSDGKGAKWQSQKTRVVSKSDTRSELESSAVANVGTTSAEFTSRITAEYDGLVLFEVSCKQPDKLPLEGMTIEIPVKTEHALYQHRTASSWIPTSGYVPKPEGVVDKTAFAPYAWLGDNDRGLFWFCESDEMWPNSRAENAIEIVRAGDEVAIRLNLLTKDQKLPPHWNLIFGLQATPVKPIPRNWRKWRFSPGRNANVQIVWPSPTRKDSLSDFGWPRAADPAAFAEHIKGLHDKGLKAVPYLCLTWVTDSTPEWKYFRNTWDMGSVDGSIPAAGWKHQFALVSPVAKGYSDFVMTKTKEFLDQYGIDGTYHDQTHPYTSNRVESGVGYERNGKRHITYPILGYRALYRRNYAVVKSLPRETFTNAHMSGKVTIPILAYDDSYLDGEHFRRVVKDSYMDVMTLDSFRAEYMGRQWGLMPFFIPEFDEVHRAQVEPTRGMMALLMIHDVSPWPIWCNEKVVDEAFAALDEFGYVDANFLPYFDATPPATTDMQDVYVSAYKRDDGKALLIVGNLSKEDRQGTVRIDASRLGLPLSQVVSWPDKSALTVSKESVTIDVPRLGYRMLLIQR
ncbi:MAG: hypothetical protein AUJ92_07515 [Armatimonadetes bacterium CG2_30_59_28]|nr:LamG domain-containing protein [Armatimonadota bacterium]OIO95739.1 MAG: hypothetical protein AUJ92_07515 [Armatimonadetes bacterium CG2_30_59_28]